MDIWQILMTPFSLLLKLFCQVFDSYGIALILFTIVVKIILFPLQLKSKKSMIKMNVVNAQIQEIQKRCGSDKERYNQELQKFYAENNASPLGGCGWSLIPMLILWPLYAIIRRPLKYMMNLTEAATTAVGKALGWADFAPVGYNELTLGSMMSASNLAAAKDAAAAAGVSAAGMFVINFDFFGIDLSLIPQLKFWEGGLSWGAVGLFLLPVISAAISLASMFVTQKTNQMNKDQEAPKMNLSLLLLGPGMSLFIGFGMPAGMCVYWIANSLLIMVQEVICGAMLRKDYEAAQKEMAEQAAKAKEAEKERRRIAAEKKAAAIAAGKDPKKAHQKKAKEPGVDLTASREGLRAYARGRAYDPNRYPVTPYYDPSGPAKPAQEELEEPAPEKAEDEVKIVSLGEKVSIEAAPSAGRSPEEKPAGDSGDYEEAYAEDEEEN